MLAVDVTAEVFDSAKDTRDSPSYELENGQLPAELETAQALEFSP